MYAYIYMYIYIKLIDISLFFIFFYENILNYICDIFCPQIRDIDILYRYFIFII